MTAADPVALLRDLVARCDGAEGVGEDGSNTIDTRAANVYLAELDKAESDRKLAESCAEFITEHHDAIKRALAVARDQSLHFARAGGMQHDRAEVLKHGRHAEQFASALADLDTLIWCAEL